MSYMNFNLPSIVLNLFCLLYCFLFRKRFNQTKRRSEARFTEHHTIYLILILFTLISCICSFASEELEFHPERASSAVHTAFLMGYFIFHTAIPTLYALYIMALNGSTIGRTSGYYAKFFLPLALCEVLICLTPFTKLVFYLDEASVYHRGSLMFLLYMAAAYYVVLGTLYFIRNKKANSTSTNRIITVMVCLSIAGIAIQLANPDLIVETFAESVSFLGFLLTLESANRNVDPLTGVFHRIAFDEENKKRILAGQPYSVIHIHLDNLSLFSRLLSVKSADDLLVQISLWFTTIADRKNIFSYHAQDFLIVVDDPDETKAQALAQQILERFNHPWHVEDLSADINAVISVVRIPDDASTDQELDRIFEIASTRHTHEPVMLTTDDIEQFKRELLIEKMLSRAIEEKTVEVWYQPIWSSETNTIEAAEALARLIDPEYGFIPPDEFIPIAEKNGMIMALGSLVFEKVCTFIEENSLASLGLSYIEINLSMYQFLQEHLDTHLKEIMARHHVSVDMINLEITESMSDDTAPFIEKTMRSMIDAGFTFSLDDYGTAYSNTQRLITGNYMNIKIDKSFLWDADRSESTRMLLEYMIRTIRAIGLNVVQEGVENEAQLNQVVSYGCNLVQGYYFSKPIKPEPFLDYVRTFNHIDTGNGSPVS